MATKQTVLATLCQVALIFWNEIRNERKDYGDEKDTNGTRNSLATYQWMPDNSIPVTAITESEMVACMAQREATWDTLKKATTPEAAVRKIVWEAMYVKDGKLIKPEYSANAGFRRGRLFVDAMVQRFSQSDQNVKDGKEKLEISGLIPVRPVVYANEIERIIDQQLENELQNIGVKQITDIEKLRTTKKLFDLGCREVEIRRLYSSSTGQKAFALCLANQNWPALDIYNRFFLEPTHPDRIPWKPIRAPEVSKLNQRFEAQRKAKENLPLSKDERGLPEITEKEVDDFFRDKAKGVGTGNASKIMPKTDIENLSKRNKLALVRKAADSVLHDVDHNLAKYMDHADGLNAAVDLIDADKGAVLDSVMVAVKTDPELFKLIADLVKDGKGAGIRSLLTPLTNPQSAPAPAEKSEGKPVKSK